MPTYPVTIGGETLDITLDHAPTKEEAWQLFHEAKQRTQSVASNNEQKMVAGIANATEGPSGLRKAAAFGAGMAIRGAGTVFGAIAGTSLGPVGTLAGGAAGAGVSEGPARVVEDAILDRPNVPPTALETTAAMLGGAAAPVARAGNLVRFLEGAKMGGIAGGAENASRQISEGRVDPYEFARATAISAGAGGVLNRFLGPKPVPQAKNSVLPTASKSVEQPLAADTAGAVAQDVAAPAIPGQKERGLVTSAKASDSIKDPLKDMLDAHYWEKSNGGTFARVNQTIADIGEPKARLLFQQLEQPSAEGNALGIELARRYQEKGDFGEASNVLLTLSRRATSQGQAIQILSNLSQYTAEGMLMFANKMKGEALTAAEASHVGEWANAMAKAGSETTKIARAAEAYGRIQAMVAPVAGDSKIRAGLNLAMLLNPKTQIRNTLGNVFMMGMESGVDAVAAPIDKGVSFFTGERTVFGPQLAERLKGLAQPKADFMAGYNDAINEGLGRWDSIKRGVDTVAAMSKLQGASKAEVGDLVGAYRHTFSNPVAQAAEKTLTVTMGAPDRAFFTSAFMAEKANLLQAAREAGQEAVMTPEMLAKAQMKAAEATFQNENFLSTGLLHLRKGLNELSTLGKSKEIGLGQAILPYTQVPGAILAAGANYSPVGFIRAAYNSVGPVLMETQFDQRKFVDSLSKAIVGSGGMFGTGYAMAKLGLIQGLPDQDQDMEAMRKAAGVGGYTVNASALKRRMLAMDFDPNSKLSKPQQGDAIVSYDWIQPAAIPFAMGAEAAIHSSRAAQQPGNTGYADPSTLNSATLAGLRTMEQQPLLSGLARFFNSARANGSYTLAAGEAVLSLPTQAVPVAASMAAAVQDSSTVETRTSSGIEQAYNQAAARLPFVAEKMGFPQKYDTLGKAVQKYGDALIPSIWFNAFLNPAVMTELKKNPVADEVVRVFDDTGKKDQAPKTVDKTMRVTIGGKPVTLELGPQEISDMQFLTGRMTNDLFMRLVAAPNFIDAPAEAKAKIMASLISDVNTAAKVMRLGHRPEKLSKGSQDILEVMLVDPETRKQLRLPEQGAAMPPVRQKVQ